MSKKIESSLLHEKLNNIASKLSVIINKESTDESDTLKKEFADVFNALYEQSQEDNYYWQYCSFKVYEYYFEQNKKEYLEKFEDAVETDFVREKQFELIDKSNCENWYSNPLYIVQSAKDIPIKQVLDEVTLRSIQLSYLRKKEYLESQVELTKKEIITMEEDIVDYSDNKATEKIVFLHELGILDYLRSFKPLDENNYKLAKVLSTFTGIKEGTIQSYINPIYKEFVSQKSNPLKEENILKVHKHLNNIGLDIDNFKIKK